MVLPRGVDGYDVVCSLGAGPSQREVSWLGRHEGESWVLKACGVGRQGLGNVPILPMPLCGKVARLVGPGEGPGVSPGVFEVNRNRDWLQLKVQDAISAISVDPDWFMRLVLQ